MAFVKFKSILEVSWNDHQNWTGWRDADEQYSIINDNVKFSVRCKTVGYYIGENKISYYLAQSIANDKDVNNVMQILKGDITKIRRIA